MTRNRAESQATSRLRSNSNLTSNSVEDEDSIEHPVESRTRTAELPPVMVSAIRTLMMSGSDDTLCQNKIVDEDPMSWLGFEEDCILTACAEGHIRIWNRPREGVNGSQVALSGRGIES